ncbi:putative serine/threonine-protein kinase PBL28 [Forsythia ovata]|uniref:Serine/threonine-protein kinase PBL28 n=1 Tax=Forsythia ovata TaxID=205694 RepID=A0ABD1SMQ4_9LAMI
MSTNDQRVLIVQGAFWEICTVSIKQVLRGSWLQPGGKTKLLVIIQAFRNSTGCGALLSCDRKLHSSATINKKKEDIEEEIQEKIAAYSKNAEISEILKLAEMQQVEFEIAVEAGKLKEVAVEYAMRFEATHVILHRQLRKHQKYFMDNLTCGILRMKHDNSIETIREVEADEQGSLLNPETLEQEENAFENYICTLCKNIRLSIGQKKEFTYTELQLATNGFASQNSLPDQGKKIYRGQLNGWHKIMIREHPSETIKDKEFKIEIHILGKVKHENVAMFLGSCSEGTHRLLVYEYVCNGSLNKYLSEKCKKLTWERRINIAYGAAKGLEYLHRERIHGSMRPNNILVTHDYQPLLSYYGLAKNQYEALGHSSDAMALRPFEYLAPEYAQSGIDMSKADVYSFGIVLLELISGRKTLEDTKGQTFLRWARPILREKKYMELIDPAVQESLDLYQLFWMVRLAEQCLDWDPKLRMSMHEV